MMYLFDTDILSNLMKKSPSRNLQAHINSTSVGSQFTSSVTLGELIYGARRRNSRKLLARIEQLVTEKLPILPFDSDAAVWYGKVRAELESRGAPIGDADMRIAAIALARELTVVTGNTKHFQRISGLTVVNWL